MTIDKFKVFAAAADSSDTILVDLEKQHAAAWKFAYRRIKLEDGRADSDEYHSALAAADAICKSTIAFPAKRNAGLMAKARIILREYPEMSASEILHETERGRGDIIAALLEDLLALARNADVHSAR